MGTVYSIKFKVNDQEDQRRFIAAFNDIHKLAKVLYNSENKAIKNYIKDSIGKNDETWLKIDQNSVSAMAEFGLTEIERNDAEKIPNKIEYYFGKVYPALPEFLAAVISIIYHYFPKAELSRVKQRFVGSKASF